MFILFFIYFFRFIFAAVIRCFFAEVAQLVEHNLAKVRVAGSSPVFRSRLQARMVESVDTRDLKSLGHNGCGGSSPPSSTRRNANCLFIRWLAFLIWGFAQHIGETIFHYTFTAIPPLSHIGLQCHSESSSKRRSKPYFW